MRTSLSRLALALALAAIPVLGSAQQALVIKPLAERRVAQLPAGIMFWRIDKFPTAADAAAAASGPWSLAVESAGAHWLFTLGPVGGSTRGGTPVVEVGPIPRIEAKAFLLRINDASGPPGSVTAVHSHPGSEAFFVLEGQQTIRGKAATLQVNAGEAEPGNGADQVMQVSSTGTSDLHALVMFVVDADRPFSSPSSLP